MAHRNFAVKSKRSSNPLHAALAAGMSREREILSVFRPANASQDQAIQSPADTLVVAGGNRSGKSFVSFSLAASRMTGQPLFGLDGNPVIQKFYTPQEGDISRYWLIGYNLDHIGMTFYRMFFEPGMGGQFYVIYDQEVEKYVTWNETNAWHKDHKDDRELAEPLIPPRLIHQDSWTWNQYGGGKAKNCFSSVELTNGAIIYAFPSTTPQPKQGDPIHGLLLDEDVAHGAHVSEYFARLMDNRGWAIWSAWPHDSNYVLGNLIDGCKMAMENGDPRSEYVLLKSDENPFFTDDTVDLAVDRMMMLGDEELIDSRVHGVQAHEGRMMYDFSPMVHGISSEHIQRAVPELSTSTPRGALQAVYRKYGRFPDAWTRYLAIDPSTQRAAVVFGVVPPPEVFGTAIPPTLIIENEIVYKRATPEALSMAIKEIIGVRKYEAFVIDRNFGRQRQFTAGGMNAFEIMYDMFKKHDVQCRQSGQWCIPGCNDPDERQTIVRELLEGAIQGSLAVYVLLDSTPQFQKEIKRYYKKKTDFKGVEVIEDTPENPRKFDVMAALEYLSKFVYDMMKCRQHYVAPSVYSGDASMASVASSVMTRGGNDEYIHLGPGAKA